jgi:hypothetical protein
LLKRVEIQLIGGLTGNKILLPNNISLESLIKLEKFVEAHRWAKKHYHLVEKTKPNADWVHSCRNLGMVLLHLHDFKNAQKEFNAMELLAKQLNDPAITADVIQIQKIFAEGVKRN